MHLPTTALALLPAAACAAAVHGATSCPVVFDGRVPQSATGATFDSGSLPYNSEYDLGAGLTWAEVLQFPKTARSLFDNGTTRAVEVTLSDASVFQGQTGFRRAELLAEPADAAGSVAGAKTLHWSMMADRQRPLNYSHEYQLVWLERADYAADQFTVGAGVLYPGESGCAAKVLFLRGNDVPSGAQQTLWQTAFTDGVWHNFAVGLDFARNQVRLLYSAGHDPLRQVHAWAADDLTGEGEYHFGLLKKPTGPAADITKDGFQETGISEGIVYGGIFEEDSSGGCVSTAPPPPP